MTDLATLEAAREQAWRAYDAVQRDLPDCEHVRAWRQEIAEARKKHLAALRELDRAATQPAVVTQPEPAPPSLPDDTSQRETLFEIEAA